jgi:ABC-type branched-subunit amino acid transport system substrate-binding protein
MSTSSHRGSRWLALLVVLGLFLAACGNSDDEDDAADDETTETTEGGEKVALDVPGVTDDEIRFAAFGTNSNNPLGTCVLDCYVDGIEAYFAWRNSEGGIHGRKLVLSKSLDDELGKNQVRALEIVGADEDFGAFSATQIASGWKSIAEAGMPLYTWSIHPESNGIDSIFGYLGAACYTCTSRATAYIAKLAKAKKQASFGYGVSENSKLCARANVATMKKYSAEIGGVESVYLNDDLPFGLPNGVAPEVTAMKRAGVDFINACIDLNGMKTMAQELQRQGMGDVTMVHPNTYDQDFVTAAGDLFEGDYVSVAFRPFEADAAGSDLGTFKKWMDETGSKIKEISMIGWINADLAYQGLKAAGPNFDRQKVIDATNALEDYTAGGLIPPIDWGRQHVPPTEEDPGTHGADPFCFSIVQIKNGKFQVVGDKEKPFLCWPGDTREWSEPEPTNFE